MELKGVASDLLSHLFLLGAAAIIEQDEEIISPATITWKDPTTMQLSTLDGAIDFDDLANAIWRYKEKTLSERDLLERTITIDIRSNTQSDAQPKNHSPISPRVASSLSDTEWKAYFTTRTQIIDGLIRPNVLITRLACSLGYPSYWSASENGKDKALNLYHGASTWEMASRKSGREFIINKYLKMLNYIAPLTVDDIAARLTFTITDSKKEKGNACGFHKPESVGCTDVLIAWIAYHGIACFPTRPVVNCTALFGSLSTGVIVMRKDHRRVFFTLPITNQPVTLARYLSLCRSSSLYRATRWAFDVETSPQCTSMLSSSVAPIARDIIFLNDHQVHQIALFERYEDDSSKQSVEYWALPGRIATLPSLEA